MSLASLVDKPLMQNPLAGGGAPQIIDPSVITPRGGGLTGEMQMSNMGAKIDPFADMKARGPEMPQPEVYTNPVTKEILDGFNKSDFAKNVNHMQQDVATININGLPITGNGSFIGNLTEYIRSIGKGDILSGRILEPGGVLSGVPLGGSMQPTRPEQNPNAIRVPADPIQTGGLGDQGLMDRLTSLEQGIGSLQNQIASLFQTQQASDPFGLGGFINTRRF
jgi:hypothetical protein